MDAETIPFVGDVHRACIYAGTRIDCHCGGPTYPSYYHRRIRSVIIHVLQKRKQEKRFPDLENPLGTVNQVGDAASWCVN